MQTQKLLDIHGDDTRAQIVALRKALTNMQGTASFGSTKAAQAAHSAAHIAYISSFNTQERAIALQAAQARNPAITTYEEALEHYGTSLLDELQEQGLLTDV